MIRTLQIGDRVRGLYTGDVYVVGTIRKDETRIRIGYVTPYGLSYSYYGPRFWTFFEKVVDERPRPAVVWGRRKRT